MQNDDVEFNPYILNNLVVVNSRLRHYVVMVIVFPGSRDIHSFFLSRLCLHYFISISAAHLWNIFEFLITLSSYFLIYCVGALDSRYTEGDLVFIETIFERILFEKVSLEVFVRYYNVYSAFSAHPSNGC